jgi:hypothetical protein
VAGSGGGGGGGGGDDTQGKTSAWGGGDGDGSDTGSGSARNNGGGGGGGSGISSPGHPMLVFEYRARCPLAHAGFLSPADSTRIAAGGRGCSKEHDGGRPSVGGAGGGGGNSGNSGVFHRAFKTRILPVIAAAVS